MAAAVAGVLIGAACLANLVWEATQQPHTVWRLSLLEHLKWGRLPSLGQEMVGVFGWLEFKLPHPTYWIWGILTLVLVGLAVAVGRWRDRRGTPSRSVPLIPVTECSIGKEVAVLCHLEARGRTARGRLAVPQNRKTAWPHRAETPHAISCRECAAVSRQQDGTIR